MFIDTHTHLYLEDFDNDIDEVIKRCTNNSVNKFFLPNIDSTSVAAMHKLCDTYPQQCFPMMGLHPCSVKENYKEELNTLYQYFNQRKYYAVGEIGIDLYWDKTFYIQQVDAFETQINWALELDLPIVIHCRNAFDEIYGILKKQAKLPPGIFHCFSGNAQQAQQIIDLGNFYLGIGGVLTYKNSGLDKALADIDLKYLVLETDSPYLTPVPYRGKRNESSYIPIIAQKLADIKNCSTEEIAAVTTQNAIKIFGETS